MLLLPHAARLAHGASQLGALTVPYPAMIEPPGDGRRRVDGESQLTSARESEYAPPAHFRY